MILLTNFQLCILSSRKIYIYLSILEYPLIIITHWKSKRSIEEKKILVWKILSHFPHPFPIKLVINLKCFYFHVFKFKSIFVITGVVCMIKIVERMETEMLGGCSRSIQFPQGLWPHLHTILSSEQSTYSHLFVLCWEEEFFSTPQDSSGYFKN